MTRHEIAAHVDHTLLRPEATWPQVRKTVEEALAGGAASVCINGGFVAQAAAYLREKGAALPICTVVGFPLGAAGTAAKVAEAAQAVADGAAEVDMVLAIGRLKNGEADYVREEIAAVKAAIGGRVLKVIIECCLLTEAEKTLACELVCQAGADYVKTSTGFAGGGATFEDVALLVRCAAGRCKVKAAGGIASVADMERFLQLGAERLGSSSALRLLAQSPV